MREEEEKRSQRFQTGNPIKGPIGLSLMVTVSVLWMDHTMTSAVKLAKTRRIAVPRLIFTYVDDCFATVLDQPTRPGLRSSSSSSSSSSTHSNVNNAIAFNDCLNSVHPRVQFTREDEENMSLPFLDVLVTRDDDGKMHTEVYRKASNTNIGLKPQSCQDPRTAVAAFKGELCRCHRLCSSPEKTKEAINFVLEMFEDNGHNRQMLQQVADSYQPPPIHQNKEKKQKQQQKQKQKPTALQRRRIRNSQPLQQSSIPMQ